MKTGEKQVTINVTFLSNEGLGPTIIESQVLSVARRLSSPDFLVTVVVLAPSAERYEQALRVRDELAETYDLSIVVLRAAKMILPGSIVRNARLVEEDLSRLGRVPNIVHARTEYSAAIAVSLRKTIGSIKVVWDCRGDTLNEHHFRWSFRSRWLRPLGKLAELRIRQWLDSARGADAALFVSEALSQTETQAGYHGMRVVVPNGANPEMFRVSHSLRRETRQRLRIPETAPVLIYVGSTAPWQCFREMREAIETLAARNSELMTIVVCDEPEQVRAQFSEWIRPRLRVETGRLSEIPAYLNAADVAFLMRSPGPISKVASPVKFAEYVMCGLPIIHNATVEQVNRYASLLNCSFPVDDLLSGLIGLRPREDSEREDLASRASSELSIERTEQAIRQLYARLLGWKTHTPDTDWTAE